MRLRRLEAHPNPLIPPFTRQPCRRARCPARRRAGAAPDSPTHDLRRTTMHRSTTGEGCVSVEVGGSTPRATSQARQRRCGDHLTAPRRGENRPPTWHLPLIVMRQLKPGGFLLECEATKGLFRVECQDADDSIAARIAWPRGWRKREHPRRCTPGVGASSRSDHART